MLGAPEGARVACHTYHSIAREIEPAIANMVSDWLQLQAASISRRRVSGSVEILPLLLASGSASQY